MRLLLTGCFILIISFLTFLPSFTLALFGDDWLAFYRYLAHLGPNSSGQWNHLTYFLTPYGAQDILMGLLRPIFGFQGIYYQLISFTLRLIAAFSFYPIISYLTKSKLACFFAILFFSITTTGIETTNWVFNMPSYITIALFNLFLFFFLKAREHQGLQLLFLSAIFYYLAYVVTPIRMHGSLPFIFLLELFWILQKRNTQTVKQAVIRFAIILAVFLFIRFTGQSQGPPQEAGERLIIGIESMSKLFSQGRFDFVFYPLIMLGGMFIPDIILPSNFKNVILLMVGGIILAMTIYLIIILYKKVAISTSLFIGLYWSILSFFFAWWWVPETIFPSYQRYVIVSAVGITILLASLVSLGRQFKNQLYLSLILSPFLILQLFSTNHYLNLISSYHNQKISDNIWSAFPYIPEVGKEPLVFYFETSIENYPILHNVITFGFPPHMALLYNLTEADKLPVPMSNFQEVISAVKDGQSFKAYGYPLTPIPIDNVFAFRLQDEDTLVNITDLARQVLRKEMQK